MSAVAAHAASLAIPVPAVAFAPPAWDPWDDGFSRLVRDAYARPFLAFQVRQAGMDRIFAEPGRLSALTPAARGALAAHEVGHAADWWYRWRHAALSRLVPHRLHARLEARLDPWHEGFAERLAAHLAGAGAVASLHAETAALLGVPGRSPPPVRPGLPTSLRLRAGTRACLIPP